MTDVDFSGSITSKSSAKPYTVVADRSPFDLSSCHSTLPIRSTYAYGYERRMNSLMRLSTISEDSTAFPSFPDISHFTRINMKPINGVTLSVRPIDGVVEIFATSRANAEALSVVNAIFNSSLVDPEHQQVTRTGISQEFKFISMKNSPADEDVELISSEVKITRLKSSVIRVTTATTRNSDIYSVKYATTVT